MHDRIPEALPTILGKVKRRKFKDAERITLKLMQHAVMYPCQIVKDVEQITTIYTNFNSVYLQWVESIGLDPDSETQVLFLPKHNNFLISHCSDPESMDDLLFETALYLTDKNKHQKGRLLQMIESYMQKYRIG